MQIHELTTKKKNTQLDEVTWGQDPITDLGQAAGKTVSGVKNIGSAIASPFKDIAQGYSTARQDQKVNAVADKAFRAWQKYVAQLEQSIAVQPAPAKTAPGTTAPAGIATKDATAPGVPAKTPLGTTQPNTMANAPVSATNKAVVSNANATTAPATTAAASAKPNYGAQTGGGTNIKYNQPTGVPTPLAKTPQPTSKNMMEPPAKTPATVASTAPGQPITVGGQKIKPGQPGYDQLAKATLKELQAPATAVSPALAAFRDRTDGKYEAYLKAFVQKNLLAGLGFRGLVNQQEIDNAIKAIASPANADPAKQRPLWNDLARAAALAVPAAGALTGRTPGATKDSGAKTEAPVGYKIDDLKGGTITKTDKGWFRSADNYLIPTNSLAHKDYEEVATSGSTKLPDNWYNSSGKEQPPEEQPTAQAEPAKPTMTKAQISQWISRNSEDNATLKAALDAINAVKG